MNRKSYIGKNNPRYIDGRTLKKYFCFDCGIRITDYKATRCKKCAYKHFRGRKHWNYKNIPRKYCELCFKKLHKNAFYYDAKRCKKCNNKNKKHTTKHNLKISKTLKKIWKNKRFRKIMIYKILHSQKRYMNKLEKNIFKLLKKYKYCFEYSGNKKYFINGFNPDFINKKRKLIIEVFGDYWHNLLKRKKRDKERVKSYKNFGYKVLIIWEHELKNIEILIKKIGLFYNK